MHSSLIALLLMLFLPLSLANETQPTSSTLDNEIQYLFNFVRQTSCLLERNGTQYNGAKAAEHIDKKYQYYKDDIQSAEDFIRLSATKSTFSGKKYVVYCQGQSPQHSEDWLLSALAAYRK